MRAIVAQQPGGPEVLQLAEVPEPQLQSGDLLIGVRAAGLNRADLLQRQGWYPPPPGESKLIGLEVAGEVLEVAPGAEGQGPLGRTYRKGERVMALLAGGGYAERVRVPAAQALPIPAGLSFEEAAAIPEVFLTAWLNLFSIGRLQRGEAVVIHAAGSGVGTAALQLCRGVAGTIFATASEAKLASLPAFGATDLLARASVPEELGERVRAVAPGGANLILDLVGGSYLAANVDALAMYGRLVCISTQGGIRGELELLKLMQKRLSIIGSTLRTRTAQEKAALCSDFAAHALPRFESGELRPVLARALPFAEAALAHALLAGDALIGKIVLSL